MRTIYLALARALDRVTLLLCATAGLVLVGMVLVNVVLRYGFGTGSIALQDLAGYAFAVFVITALPVCLARGGHVRVEVFSERRGPGYLRAADTVALILFLIPLFGLIVWAGWGDLVYSWRVREGSMTPGGLGGLYIVRTVLPVAAVLMIVQGIAAVIDPPAAARDPRG
ncbi:TRAP transporter small permease subunit [Pararhodobacter sp. SW119]|uniref:TRAP transporter small permease subunit n=1 Tax=Pararhodobacter sp. SW119 TaxID=2780075 RepID=UPI001FD7CAE7|nr:TRAP transporter small permease subunit [Pararhodobacter sp. SW119]